MEVINIKGTDDTPNVILDKASGQFELSGRSLPEDVNQFYEQILDWIDEYAKIPWIEPNSISSWNTSTQPPPKSSSTSCSNLRRLLKTARKSSSNGTTMRMRKTCWRQERSTPTLWRFPLITSFIPTR